MPSIFSSIARLRSESPHQRAFLFFSLIISHYRAWKFSQFYSRLGDALIHETGHALAAKALYQNAYPKMTIWPQGSGTVTYASSHLSIIGKYMGKNASLASVAAMGVLFSTLASLIYIYIGHCLQDSDPDLARHCHWAIFTTSQQNVDYALSALNSSSKHLSHDFVRLWVIGGIHPYACVASLLFIPLALKLLLLLKDQPK